MDEIRELCWHAIKRHWPADAQAHQDASGSLHVSFPLPAPNQPGRRAQEVAVRIAPAVIRALEQAHARALAAMLAQLSTEVGYQMHRYDPAFELPTAYIVSIEPYVLAR